MASLKNRLASALESDSHATPLLSEGVQRLANVPVENIEPDPDQPRKSLGNLDELMASIKEHGIIQPIVVSPSGTEKFRIIAGERRFSAAQKAGLKTVPAIIRSVEEHRRLEVQLIENIHRQELNPLEEADAYRRLMEEFQLSQRQLATRLGKSPAAINEALRILSLPDAILESVRTSEHLSRSVLLEIAKQDSEAAQQALWKAALAGTLTVKEAREKKSNPEPVAPKARFPIKTNQAMVTVIFESETASDEDLLAALTEAVTLTKRRMKK